MITSIYSPKDSLRSCPILIQRTPYGIGPDPQKFSSGLKNMTHLMEEGYIIVFQNVRGKYMSEGENMNIRPFIPGKKTAKPMKTVIPSIL